MRPELQRQAGNVFTAQSNNDHYLLYKKYCKPKLADMLNSLKLDYAYEKARGNYLFYRNEQGVEIPVVDFVGGFGSTFLGHNNPRLKQELKNYFDEDVPMFAQSAIRPAAHSLAKKLNELIPAQENYYCNYSNSGAESVEAACKHAYRVRQDAILRTYDDITRKLYDFYAVVENINLDITLPAGVKDLSKYRDDIDEYNLTQYENFQHNPVFCAFKGSFHGKTTSALSVTFNKTFREGFEGLSAIKTIFIDLDKPERLQEIIHDNVIDFILPTLVDNTIIVERHTMTTVVAMIFETILGEGGVKPLPDSTLQILADLHGQLKIPYIIDEIQTGCGRCGSIFAYSETPLSRIEPEYVLLGKALGGGLVKIAATMIKESTYNLDFGILHTSTFAEDDISCKIALETLNMITENNNHLLNEAQSKGEYVRTKLQALKNKFPQIVKDIRGKGLLIGLEFQDLSAYGPMLRYAGKQGFISLLVTSYILHHHQIRLLAPLTTLFKGNPGKTRESVLRIEPAVFITEKEIDTLIDALDEIFTIIDANNEFCLMAHLLDINVHSQDLQHPRKIPVTHPKLSFTNDFDARIGFIVHITELNQLIDYYLPSFREYAFENAKLIKWWNKLCRFLEPDVIHRSYVESGGFIVEINFVCVPYLPKYMISTYSNAKLTSNNNPFSKKYLTEMQDKIMDAAILARDLGDSRIPTSIIGLGAYTSIVTENGMTLNDFEIPITSGNAYTTALMGQGIVKASEMNNIDISRSTIAIVGAAGNIGSALSTFLSFSAQKLILIGSAALDTNSKLENTIQSCLKAIIHEIKARHSTTDAPEEIRLTGIAKEIYLNHVYPLITQHHDTTDSRIQEFMGAILSPEIEITDEHVHFLRYEIIEKYGHERNPFFEIGKLSDVGKCEIVAIATNSPDGLLQPDMVQEGAIVCCASVPSNLSEAFKNHTDKFFVFDGGYAKLPNGSSIDFVGMPAHGMAYGCLCETLLLAFDGQNSSFAKNKLTIQQLMKTIELADMYGFEVGDFRLGNKIISIN